MLYEELKALFLKRIELGLIEVEAEWQRVKADAAEMIARYEKED